MSNLSYQHEINVLAKQVSFAEDDDSVIKLAVETFVNNPNNDGYSLGPHRDRPHSDRPSCIPVISS